jgi:hypothetical protein
LNEKKGGVEKKTKKKKQIIEKTIKKQEISAKYCYMLIKTIRQGGKINNKTGNIVCIENLTNHVIFLMVLVFPFQNQSKIEKSKNRKIEKLKNREKKLTKIF